MNSGKTVFSQVMDFLPLREFHKCVTRYRGHHKVRKFSCLDQFLCMAFAQLTYRESLRDIEACLRAMQSKLYHMGIRTRVSRSTLGDANEKEWSNTIRKVKSTFHDLEKVIPGHGKVGGPELLNFTIELFEVKK